MKKLLSASFIFILVGIIFSAGSIVSAQTATGNLNLVEATPEQLAEMNNLPSVEVKDISLLKNVYAVGEVVTGKVTILNGRDYNIPDLKYKVSLVGDYQENGLAGVAYTSQFFGPVFLKASEEKEIIFNYTLPQNVAGKGLGIQIQFYTASGLPLSWRDSLVEITGVTSVLKVAEAYVSVGEKKYGLQAGPTLSATKPGIINIRVENPLGQEKVLTPVINIYDRTVSGALLKTIKLNSFTVSAKETKSFAWPISYLDQAGVYEVAVDFVDATNVKTVPTVLARYIVGGAIATIQRVTLDKNILVAGEAYNMEVSYSGTPNDIDTLPTASVNSLKLAITVTNENDKVISTYNQELDFNKGTSLSIPLVSDLAAQNIFVKIVVTDSANNTVSTYSSELTGNVLSPDGHGVLWALGALVVLLVIIISIFNRKNKAVKTLVVFALVFISAGLFSANTASASIVWTKNVSWNNLGNTYINLSSPNSVLAPGEHFKITGSMTTIACANSSQSVVIKRSDISTTHGNTPSAQTYNINNYFYRSGGEVGTFTGQLSLAKNGEDFIAPTTPGIYYIDLSVNVVWTSSDGGTAAIAQGYIVFTVRPPAPVLTAVTSPDCGGKVVLNWTPVEWTDYYRVLKNGISATTTTALTYETQALAGDKFTVAGAHDPTGSASISITKKMNTGGTVTLSWHPFPGAIGYEIFKNGATTTFLTLAATATSTVVESTTRDRFTGKPVLLPIYSESSNEVSVAPSLACDPVSDLSVSCFSAVAADNLKITWKVRALGGTSPYSYSWIVDGASSSTPDNTYYQNFSTAVKTLHYATSTVVDKNGLTKTVVCPVAQPYVAAFSATCSGQTISTEYYDNIIQWTVIPANGTTPYSAPVWAFSGERIWPSSGDVMPANSAWQNIDGDSIYTAQVTVTDNSSPKLSTTTSCQLDLQHISVPCTGVIPVDSLKCVGTIEEDGGAWHSVTDCSVIPAKCEYKKILPPPGGTPITGVCGAVADTCTTPGQFIPIDDIPSLGNSPAYSRWGCPGSNEGENTLTCSAIKIPVLGMCNLNMLSATSSIVDYRGGVSQNKKTIWQVTPYVAGEKVTWVGRNHSGVIDRNVRVPASAIADNETEIFFTAVTEPDQKKKLTAHISSGVIGVQDRECTAEVSVVAQGGVNSEI